MGTGIGLAGDGSGVCDGTGPIHDIFAGIPFEIEGEVVTVQPGQGLEILSVTGDFLIVYGIGPRHYWTTVGVDRPTVGDALIVRGYIVDYNGLERHIATSVEIDGVEVVLRDAETGLPLWRGNGVRKVP